MSTRQFQVFNNKIIMRGTGARQGDSRGNRIIPDNISCLIVMKVLHSWEVYKMIYHRLQNKVLAQISTLLIIYDTILGKTQGPPH